MARKLNRPRQPPLRKIEPARDVCLEVADYSTGTFSAMELFQSSDAAQAARLTDQFLKQNAPVLDLMGVQARRDFDGRDLLLKLETSNGVGAVPLIAPQSARHDLGLVVQPRFAWSGIGPMLAEMGWLPEVTPRLVKLPLLRRSERRVPPWVLSLLVLTRLKALLDRMERRFEIAVETRSAPRGRVDWTQYATRNAARGAFLEVPCVFPDLRDDRSLKGAIRFTLEKQIGALETQRAQGTFLHRLIVFAESLLKRVRDCAAARPSAGQLSAWMRHPLRGSAFAEGLQAMEWTVDDRGLAGASDLEGLPWVMPMERFFEAWVETIARRVAQRTGAAMRVGRRQETIARVTWEPSWGGTQRALIPDVVLEWPQAALIFDAKYKRHWEELQTHRLGADTMEAHRADFLQVLAYANLVRAPEVYCCLVYPCTEETFGSLLQRNRLFDAGTLPDRGRRVHVWLTAVPMNAEVDRVAAPIEERIRGLLRGDER